MAYKNVKKGQLSIELIIILAVLLAVVFLVASKMRESAEKASSSIENTSNKIDDIIRNMTTQEPIAIKEPNKVIYMKSKIHPDTF